MFIFLPFGLFKNFLLKCIYTIYTEIHTSHIVQLDEFSQHELIGVTKTWSKWNMARTLASLPVEPLF